MKYYYCFPVVKGVQANRNYYIAMVPLKMIPRLFPAEQELVAPEYRAQRKLNEARIPIITKYILDNRDSYVFSALAASIDGEFEFAPDKTNGDVGVLNVPMDSKFLINDGQHRKAAILDALNEDETLGDETISIVFYADKGLSRSQQIFTDLNKNAVKTSNSISELYDSRDPLAVLNRQAVMENEFLNSYTDKEKDILGKYSSNFFTLNTFYTSNKSILGNHEADDEALAFLNDYWAKVVQHMEQWQEVQKKEITKIDLRENYISTQSVVIQAFGLVGHSLFVNRDLEIDEYLKNLQTINWKRTGKAWFMRAINASGKVMTNKKAIHLIANEIKMRIGLKLDEDDERYEKELRAVLAIGKQGEL